ncbi:MAG: hypothetical protein NTNFB02_16920 [Nitrospira sp.]
MRRRPPHIIIAISGPRRRWPGLRQILCVALASLQLSLPSLAAALPSDGHVVGGLATIQQTNPATLNIQQTTDKAILNWQSFSIGAHEAVRFVQPSVSSIALNRVIGVDPSVILGQLQANGRIFLVNPNGILFGAGAQIDVGGLLATTLQIRDSDFMAGRLLFAQDPLKGLRSVINHGTIQVSDHGFVFLVAPGVANDGLIVANLGKVLLGSGQQLTLDLMGDGLINYAISGKVLDHVTGMDGKPLTSAVSNSGTIQADGGRVILSAKASGDIFSSVVNQSGVIRAKSLVNHGGVVRLEGSDPVANTGSVGWQTNLGRVKNADGAVINTGTIDVSAAQPGAAQGQVTITAQQVGVVGSILAKGADGAQGGRVLISSTDQTVGTSDSLINTSGVGNSSAGNIVVWSDKNTSFGGSLLAQGGALGGNGGQIEVSGHENLGFFGSVNALAPLGSAGTLLLDPRNITIATAGGAAYNPGVNNLFANTPAADVTITPASINAAAANVVLQANNDITVTNAVAMTNNGVGLTMQAGRDINVNASVSTNNGHISMTANDSSSILANRVNGTPGDITFGVGAHLSSGSGNISLTIDPATAGNYDPGSITTVRNLTTTGNIAMSSPLNVTLSGAVNAGSGTVTINANSDGAGGQNFTMNAGSSIATTNTGANAVQIIVNSPTGGTGSAALRGSITTGNGGTATVSTRGQAAVGGNTTGGAITQGAALTMNTGAAGTVALATGAAAANITLNTAGNDFTGAVGVSRAFNVALRDANALTLGASTISGTLGVTTAGALTQTGALTVTGATTLAAGAANNITLNNAGNNFSTVGITNGNNVVLTDTNALALAASTVSGTLGVTTNGALTQSGVLAVTGATTLAAGAANTINLATSANNFSTVSVTSGNNVSLRDTNTLILGASTVSGNLAFTTGGALTQSGALTVTGTTSFTATAANTDILLGTQANTFGGALSFAGTLGNFRDLSIRNVNAGATVPALAGLTALRNLALQFDNAAVALPALTLAAGGSLNVTAGGPITDSGNIIIPGTTTLTAGANNVTLDNANNFTGAVSVVSGNNVTLNDVNAVVLGPSTVSGSLNVTAVGGVTQTGALNVSGTTTLAAGAANTITLTNAGNNFSTVGIISGSNVALTDATALDLAASTVSGNLVLTIGGALTQSGALAVTGTTQFSATAANTDVLLGTQANNFGGALAFGGTQANFRDVSLRNVNAGATVPVLAGLTNLRNLTLQFDNAAITLPATTLTAGGNLTVTAGGAITDTGNLVVPGTTTLTAGANNITLDNANNFATVSVVSGNNVTLTDSNALDLGASTISGTLGVTSGGAITQSGALNVTGTTTLAAGAANNITLNNAGNTFSTVGITSGNNVALTDSNALDLGASTVSGTLNVTTNGALTQSGAVTVAGTTTLAAGAANTITLTNAANNFSTVGIISGNNVALTDSNALDLGASTISGTFGVTTGGTLSQSGVLAVTGATTATATAVNTDVLLGTQANNFTGGVSFGGTQANFRDVQLRNVNAGATVPALAGLTNLRNLTLTFDTAPIALPALTLTAGGNLNVTAGGAITETGNLVVPGTTTLTAGANNITLDNANNFATVSVVSGNNVTLNDINALDLGASTISGTLNVTTNGALTQSGAVTVAGTTTLAAGTANNITLNNAGNNFSTVGITSGNNVALTDSNALDLGASTISGTLSVTTNGALTQSGAVTVAGITTLAAGAANNITLNNAGNNFSTVGITSGNNVALTDSNALNLAASTVSGALTVTAGGAISQTGALNVAGTANFDTTAAATLGSVSLTNSTALTLNTSTVGGNLTAATTAGDLTLPAGQTLTVVGDATLTPAGNVNLLGTTRIGGTQASVGGSGSTFVLGADTNLNALPLPGTGNITVNTTGTTATFAGPPLLPSAITLNNAGNQFGGPVSVTTAAPAFTGTTTATHNLTQSAPVTLNVGQSLTVTDLGGTAGTRGNITLTNAGNSFETVTFTGGNIAWAETGPVTIGSVSANAGATSTGTLAITATGPLTQTGAITAAGTTTLAAGAANTITLTNAGNNFSTVGITSGNNVALTDSNALDLGASTISGTLGVTTGGTLSQSGVLAVTGATTATAIAVNTDVLLGTQANNFTGGVSFGGTQANFRDVQLRNVNAGATVPALAGLTNLRNLTLTFDTAPIALPALTLTAGGNLNVTAGGAITETGALTIPGTTTLATTVAGADILLNTQANNFTGAVSFGGTQSNIRDLGLRNVNAGATVPALAGLTNLRNLTLTFDNASITLLALTASGNLTATAGGAISQTGALNVAGTANFDTTAAATLGSVSLTNSTALTLNTSTVGGNLTAATTAGDLTLPAGQTLTVVGDATLTPAGNVNLLGTTRIGGTQASVGGSGSTFVLGADTNLNALPLPGTGNITVNTTGTTATFAGPPLLPSAITLNNAGNQFGGPVSVTTAAPAFTGTTTATHNLTQSAPVTLNVGQSLTVTDLGGTAGTRGNITLTNAGNSFETVTFTGGNIAWAETGPVTIGSVSANAGATSTGTLAITATGPLTQTGAITAAGTTTLAAGAANTITLTNAGNNFSTVGITSGNNVALTDSNALDLGASTVNGTLNVTTNGALTQSGAVTVAGTTTLAAGAANNITLTNAGNNFSTVGITSGNNVALTDANALDLAASTVSGSLSANAADLTIGGAVASTGSILNLAAVNSVTQLAGLSTTGANSITVTAGGPITMAAAATTTSGTGNLNYTAGTDVTLGSVSTGGAVDVIANGGSVLSAAGAGTNVTAGANSTLQAFNGVVGTQAAPITVTVNPGTLSIRATDAVSGISAFLNGAVLPSNSLILLNVPPGLVCFNACPPPPNNNPLGPFSGIIPSFNVDSVVPWYLQQPSDPPMISVFSTYVPQSVLAEERADVQGTEKSVRREVAPCFPLSSCMPPATTLSAPAGKEAGIAR